MRTFFRFSRWVLLGTVLLVGATSAWFWFLPIGVNNYINKVTIQLLIDSPELLTSLGAIDNTILDFHSGKLNVYTKDQDARTLAKLRKARAGLDRFGPEGLQGQELLSWKITAWYFDDLIRNAEFEYSGYRVNQLSGVTVDLPQFLTDIHVIESEKSVHRYVLRIRDFGRVLREILVRVEDDVANGVVPPDFIIEQSLVGMRSFIDGGAAENLLVTTLPEKLSAIGLDDNERAAYLAQATAAVEAEVIPGYIALIDYYEILLETATHDAGIWRIPGGDKIYAQALRSATTTDMSADEIHTLGLAEVERLEGEMEAILTGLGLTEGSIAQRVRELAQNPAQQFPNTQAGREELLAYLNALNGTLMSKIDSYFMTLPSQPLEIVPVPEYQQDSSPLAYYQPPALDDSRPGRFYINLKDTADNPRWSLPTLMYHEGAPGHHFQFSLQQMVSGVPLIRNVVPFNAYSEGWALYAERIAKTDMGMYDEDTLGDLGRLQDEMFRAVRLVVDTGLHARKWSREEAIGYMVEKTGSTGEEVTREIERYVVDPGQATSYKVGQLALMKMRADAEARLGGNFDLREFHEQVLMNGSMPLGILQDLVSGWVQQRVRR